MPRGDRLHGRLIQDGYGITAVPGAISAAFVLTVFADSGLVLGTLVRPLVIAVGAGVFIQVVAIVLSRSALIGSLSAAAVVLTLIDPRLCLIAVAIGMGALLYRRWRGVWPSTSPLIAFAVILFVIGAARTLLSPAFALDDLVPPSAVPTSSEVTDHPDIYLLLLDGYARTDTLAGFGYDNRWFESELQSRGFAIEPGSVGEYTQTSLVLPSMFHMAHIPEIPSLVGLPNDAIRQKRAIQEALTETPVHRRLDELGYRTVNAGYTETYVTLRASDEVLRTGQLNGFERQLLYRSTLRWLVSPAFFASEHQAMVRATFEAVHQTAARDIAEPLFVFAHVLSPHTPIVFDREGMLVTPSCLPECDISQIHHERLGMSKEDFGQAYGEQTHYINGLVLDAVDAILRSTPDAVIIIFSDHGTRSDLSSYEEWFRTFFAARVPGHEKLFGHDGRAITVFPRLFNALFGDDIPIPGHRMYVTPDGTWPLSIEPWPSPSPAS
jgi:hypothetical protein